MTKIFSQPPDSEGGSPNDQKPTKTQGEVYTVFQPTILPVSVPHTTIVKKGKKCRFTWMIGLILLLWVLATTAIIFHLAPDCLYRKFHSWTDSEPRMSPSERFVFDIAEPDIKIAPKLPALPLTADVANDESTTERKAEITKKDLVVDGVAEGAPIVKDAVPDDNEATNAIRTLLRRPDVQQVVIVGKSDDPESEQPTKGVVVVDGTVEEPEKDEEKKAEDKIAKVIDQLVNDRGVVFPAEQLIDDDDEKTDKEAKIDDPSQLVHPYSIQMPDAEAFNMRREPNDFVGNRFMPSYQAINPAEYLNAMAHYHQAMMRWQMERELYRQHMIMSMLRERAQMSEPEMPRFMMGPHHPMMMYRVPMYRRLMYRMPMYHMLFPPAQQQQQQAPTAVPLAEDTAQPQKGLQQRQDMFFQQRFSQNNVIQQRIPFSQGNELPMVRPHDASADQIFAAMRERNVDRDEIFRRLQAQSQLANSPQDQKTENEQPHTDESRDDVFWSNQRLAENANSSGLQPQPPTPIQEPPKEQKSPDEIYHELQQRALQIQQQEDNKLSAGNKQAEAEVPVIMIADSFPRRSTIPEQKDLPSTTAMPEQPFEGANEEEPAPSDPLAAFFRFFEQEAVKLNEERNPQIITIPTSTPPPTPQATTEDTDIYESSGMEVDQPEPAEQTTSAETENPSATDSAPELAEFPAAQIMLNTWNRDQYPLTDALERPIVNVE